MAFSTKEDRFLPYHLCGFDGLYCFKSVLRGDGTYYGKLSDQSQIWVTNGLTASFRATVALSIDESFPP